MNSNEFPPKSDIDISPVTVPAPPKKLSPTSGAILTAVCVLLAIIYGGMASAALPAGSFGVIFILLVFPALFAYLSIAGYAFQPVIAALASLVTPIACILLAGADKAADTALILSSTVESLVPAACGLALFLSYKYRMRRTSGIVLTASFAGVLLVCSLAVGIYSTYGALNGETVMKMLDDLRASMTDAIKSIVDEMKNNISSIGGIYENAPVPSFDAEALVDGVFNVLPAIVIVSLSVVAFLMQRVFFTCFRIFRAGDNCFTPEMKVFEVSAPTAVIFAVCFIVSLFVSSSSAAKAVLDNLTMILEPGLAVTGLSSILPRREGNTVKVGCFPIIGMIILLFISLNVAVLVLAIVGTVSVIKKAFGEIKKS